MCIYGYPAKNANTSKSILASKEWESREICGSLSLDSKESEPREISGWAANTPNNKSFSLDSKVSESREISGWAV